MPARSGWLASAGIAALAALVVFPLLFAQSMMRGLSHDEQQHVAAGVLMAREGLLPYRDFPYLHTPYLPLVYSQFLGRSEYLLLATRLFSAICDALVAGLVFLFAFRALAALGRAWRIGLASAAVFLLLASPVFVFTISRATNHDLSILFALSATACFLAGARTRQNVFWFLSGLSLALAVGTRVTFAPLFAPFAVSLYFVSRESDARIFIRRILIFCAGAAVGTLPMFWLFMEAPARFLFGVLQFSQANLEYRYATGHPQNMDLLHKFRFLFKEVVVPNFAVCAAAVVPLAIYEWQRRRSRSRFPVELGFLISLIAFLLIGSLAPSPAFEQYFGVLVPFLLLIGIHCGSRLEIAARFVKPSVAAAVMVLAASAVLFPPDYQNLDKILTPAGWTTVKRHNEALKLRTYTQGPILTLAPLYVLEAGLKIVPEFVTGPFVWRVAEFLPPERRSRLGIVGGGDLETFFSARPPDAILLGQELRWEPPLVDYALRHGFRKLPIYDKEKAIWLSPKNTLPGK